MTHARLMLALVLAVLLAASWLLPVARGAQRPAHAYALLANGQVVAISVATGEVLATQTIGEPPQFGQAAPLLARHGDVLFAVTPRLLNQELVQLDPADLAVRERLALPADVEFTALVITRSGIPTCSGTGPARRSWSRCATARSARRSSSAPRPGATGASAVRRCRRTIGGSRSCTTAGTPPAPTSSTWPRARANPARVRSAPAA